tara:strand:- start:760 stop:2184 length:1425 start_codon:yes stop_codon:yes gene_type:complete
MFVHAGGVDLTFKRLKLTDIAVNKDNDRHGSQGSEQNAISWLIKNKSAHMKSLIRDVAEVGRVFEPPLVLKLEGAKKYTVFDGNRRVAALKILRNPNLVSDLQFQSFVKGLLKSHPKPADTIQVQVEEDIDLVEEIIFRRHSGSQAGVGQSAWDPAAKQNFQVRTGKHTKLNLASEVESVFQDLGHISNADQIKRSVLNRLLSAEVYRARVGLRVKNNQLFFTHSAESVVQALSKILSDMQDGQLTLAKAWSEDEKLSYLNALDKDGDLPSVDDLLITPRLFNHQNLSTEVGEELEVISTDEPSNGTIHSHKDNSDESESPIQDDEPERSSLIPQDKNHKIDWPDDGTKRIRQIWRELQYKLDLTDHICAISVLERVLIELIVDRYVSLNPTVGVKSGDSFAKKIKKVAESFYSNNAIDKDYLEVLKKLMNGEEVVSVNTLNKYIHSAKLNPSPDHVCAIWDTLSEFVLLCLKE